MRISTDRPSEKQTRESELKRPNSQAKEMMIIRLTAIIAFLLEVVLIGRAVGFIIIAATIAALEIDKRYRVGLRKKLGKLWAIKAVAAIAVGATLATFAVTDSWLPVSYLQTATQEWFVRIGKFDLIGNWTLWGRIILIVGLPFCITTPLRILDWVMQIELQAPNARNAPVEPISVDGMSTVTLGQFHGRKRENRTKEVVRIIEKVAPGDIGITQPDNAQIDL